MGHERWIRELVWSSMLSRPKQNVGSTAVVLNDVYKLWPDMHNLFIYSSTIINVEQRKDLKRTSVHVKPRASLCTATYEAASTVEVCSLCSPRSTCTETRWVV